MKRIFPVGINDSIHSNLFTNERFNPVVYDEHNSFWDYFDMVISKVF